MSAPQRKYRWVSVVLGWLTVLTGLAVVLAVMYASRLAMGLPMGKAPLEGIRLKFITWLVICLLSIPLAFYLSRVFWYGVLGLVMASSGRFSSKEIKQFAVHGSYPDAWLESQAPEPLNPFPAPAPDIGNDNAKSALIAGLISDDEEAVATFGESDYCIVIDWRDGAEAIFEAVAPFLPPGYLRMETIGPTQWTVQAGNRPPRIMDFSQDARQEGLFVALNQVLAPDFELRQYIPVNGDGYSLYLAPTAWWQSFGGEHPKVLAKYFLPVDRLAAYMGKSYLARLFRKP